MNRSASTHVMGQGFLEDGSPILYCKDNVLKEKSEVNLSSIITTMNKYQFSLWKLMTQSVSITAEMYFLASLWHKDLVKSQLSLVLGSHLSKMELPVWGKMKSKDQRWYMSLKSLFMQSTSKGHKIPKGLETRQFKITTKSDLHLWPVVKCCVFTLYTLTPVCIFSILFSTHFLTCWQGELV